MTSEPGFDLHPLAAQDINDIWQFIAERDLLAARRVREEILSAVRRLVPFPYQGHKRPDLTSRPLRFTVVRDYLIAYAPDEKPLWVVAVMHDAAALALWLPSLEGENNPFFVTFNLIREAKQAAHQIRAPLCSWRTLH